MKLNVKFTLVIVVSIVIPIAIFAGVLFYNMEQNVIETNRASMEYKIDQSTSNINTCIDSINMATQFFISDDEMKTMLSKIKAGDEISAKELVEFKDSDITNLERLVTNNPLLYSVRVFAENDNLTELMPILYEKSRMEKLDWYGDGNFTGWYFGYKDKAYSSLLTNQSDQLICLVSKITDYKNGNVGTVEASIKMSTFFPFIYETNDKEWGALINEEGELFYCENLDEAKKEALENALTKINEDSGDVFYYSKSNEKLVVGLLEEKEIGATLVFIKNITEDVKHVYFMRDVFIVMMILLLIAISFFINYIVNKMLSQFYSILKNMREVGHGNLNVRVENCKNDEMGELGNALNKMLDRIQKLMEENIKREVMIKDSEIRALQNQINAHFIYNVLESIKMMAEIDEEYEISDAITALGKLLRYSMRWVSGNVSVREEIDYIRNYMALINLRYDFTINLSLNIPDNIMNQEIPKMSLQPIVENAILHGIEPMGEDGTIYIKAISDGSNCIIEVSDNGKGMTEDELIKLKQKIRGEYINEKEKGNGIGLHNVVTRIKMSFGEEYGIEISTAKDCYTKVSVKLPYKIKEGLQ